jgi:hypothetical protein
MAIIGDATFNDAIVIQGVAGAGKSSLTLKLCSELRQEGLHPIRVRLRDLQLDRHISEALPRALFPPDRDFPPNWQAHSRPEDFFLNGKIFDEKTIYRGSEICTYVLILDGWDEISISAAEGFKLRISKMLDELRSEYLKNRRFPVRVILTGRPSEAVSDSKFLRDETKVLTMRPLQPDQLQEFVASLRKALDDRPVDVDIRAEEKWSIPDVSHFKSIFERYERDYSASTHDTEAERLLRGNLIGDATLQGSVAVLGLPLLAHLAVRLISRWRGDPGELLENSTTLYRSLVDLTCEKAGRPSDDTSGTEGLLRIQGTDLRSLLWRTAAAMSTYGKESISFMELALRLNLQEEDLNRIATEATEDHVLTSLMISFFFKGGNTHLGCEFLHKSFREYLFAEGIIEILKDYGRRQKVSLPQRQPYWKEFDEGSPKDSRFDFSRELSIVLAPQWLRPEVTSHIEQLITWEIERAKSDARLDSIGTPTEQLDFAGWERVRDGLADIWDWWAEGVHLRPQLRTDKRTRNVDFEKTYAQELVESSAPHDPEQRRRGMEPSRIVTTDAHLGDGLIRLCALVHFQVAKSSGWLEDRIHSASNSTVGEQIWNQVTAAGKGPRKSQSLVEQSKGSWVLFAPSGEDPGYFANYVSRINGAGWRPRGAFPLGVNLSGVDLRGTTISIPIPRDIPEGVTIWAFANLSDCDADGSCFYGHDLTSVNAINGSFWSALLVIADLSKSCFREADIMRGSLNQTILKEASFEGADLSKASLDEALMDGTNLNNARIDGAKISESNMKNTIGVPRKNTRR